MSFLFLSLQCPHGDIRTVCSREAVKFIKSPLSLCNNRNALIMNAIKQVHFDAGIVSKDKTVQSPENSWGIWT